MSRIERRFAALQEEGRAGLVTYLTAGDPDPDTSARLFAGLATAGADLIEIGMPFSDPMADGLVIQEAGQRALKQGMNLPRTLALVRELRRADDDDPDRADGVLQPDLPLRSGELRAGCRRRRGRRGNRRRSAAGGGCRADRAGAQQWASISCASRPRPATQTACPTSSSTPAASSITSRSPASPVPARPMPRVWPLPSLVSAGSRNCR